MRRRRRKLGRGEGNQGFNLVNWFHFGLSLLVLLLGANVWGHLATRSLSRPLPTITSIGTLIISRVIVDLLNRLHKMITGSYLPPRLMKCPGDESSAPSSSALIGSEMWSCFDPAILVYGTEGEGGRGSADWSDCKQRWRSLPSRIRAVPLRLINATSASEGSVCNWLIGRLTVV